MQEPHCQKIRNVWHSRFQLISRGGDSVESHARSGHRLHFRAKRRTRSRSGRCFGAGDLRRQYFSHLRGGAWAFDNSGYIGPRFQRYQIAGRRVFGFSRIQNAARSPQAFEFAAQFPVAHNGGGISPGRLNVLNPKVALFFLAFLPQFIDPTSNSKIAAFLALGLTFVTTGTIWCLILAWSASSLSERLRTNETIAQWLNRTAGALFVFLGLRLATAK